MDLYDILKIIEEKEIKAYTIGKNGGLPELTVKNILNKKTKAPRKKTLEKFIRGFDASLEDTANSHEVTDEFTAIYRKRTKTEDTAVNETEDFSSLKIDDKLNLIYLEQQKTARNLDTITKAILKLLITSEKILNKTKK